MGIGITSEKIDRYPGLWFFRQDQADIFFGRKRETEELFHQVRSSRVIVLFAKSGVGKSSLLNAGLSPHLAANGFIPITVLFTRTKTEENNTALTPLQILMSHLSLYKSKDGISSGPDTRLWEQVKKCNFNGKCPVLIFDQFEDLFTYPREKVDELIKQFYELMHDRPPSRIVQSLLNIKPADRTKEQIAWASQPLIKFIFAIRSDRLFDMQRVNEIIPAIFNNRFELPVLTESNARSAIVEPAKKVSDERFLSPVFTYERGALERIINNLKDERTGEIAPYQLQIICSYIEDMIKESATDAKGVIKEITTEVFNADVDTDKVLRNHYEQVLSQLGNADEQLLCRQLLENDLMENNNRVRLPEGIVKERLKKNDTLLQKLLLSRLIKIETDAYGSIYYEISHDSLKEPILKSKGEREDQEKRENEKNEQLTRADILVRDHYRQLENPATLSSAFKSLNAAIEIYDRFPDHLKERVETRILLAVLLESQKNRHDAKLLLEYSLSLASEMNDCTLIGRVNETYAFICENDLDEVSSFRYYMKAYEVYNTFFDYAHSARLAEHLGGFKEQLFDELSRKADDAEESDKAITEAYDFYSSAMLNYNRISDRFGVKRIQRRLKRVNGLTKPWGYLIELFTGKEHTLKGNNTLRVGRDVYNDETKTYWLKNEIGFSSSYNYVSRRHVSITPNLMAEDTQSTNGTTINAIPLYYGSPRQLESGDIIVLADMLPLQFFKENTLIPTPPADCWGMILLADSRDYYYLSNDKLYSVRLAVNENIYHTLIEEGEQQDALMKIRVVDDVPSFFVESRMEVVTNGADKNNENVMAEWKIYTTSKHGDRQYTDYVLNAGNWYPLSFFVFVPKLVANIENEEKALAIGSTFQLILRSMIEFSK